MEELNSASGLASVIDFSQYSNAELQQLLGELEKKVGFLKVEVGLLESHATKLQLSNGKTGVRSASGSTDENALGDLAAGQKGSGEVTDQMRDEVAYANRKRSKGEKNRSGVVLTLTSEQKVAIATREIDETKEEIEKLKEQSKKVVEILKAEIEEASIRGQEVKREMQDFNLNLVQGAVHPQTKKLVSEKIVRYFEDSIRHKEAFIEKYRLENGTLKAQHRNLQAQLKQKEEIGEVLHAIDFDQLQIENKQFIAKIEERNAEVLSLKRIAARTVQYLNDYKIALGKESARGKLLKSEIVQRKDIFAKLSVEERQVSQEQNVAKGELDTMKSLMEQIKVPDVIDYVSLKAKQIELSKQTKSWERKCQIASVQLKRAQALVTEIMSQVDPEIATGRALAINANSLERNKHNKEIALSQTLKLVASKHQKQFRGLEKEKDRLENSAEEV